LTITDSDKTLRSTRTQNGRDKSESISQQVMSPLNSTDFIELPSVYEWGCLDETNTYIPYDIRTSNIIEREYQRDKRGAVKLTHGFYGSSSQGYLVDFEIMKQVKVETVSERTVERRMNWIRVDDHKKKIKTLE